MRQAISMLLLATSAAGWAAGATAQQMHSEPAWAESSSSLPGPARDNAYPLSSIARFNLPAVEIERIEKLRAANAQRGNRALRIGVERPLDAAARTAPLKWQRAPDGGWTARVSARSEGAAALRLGIAFKGLPADAELRVFSEGAEHSAAAAISGASISKARQVQPVFWTPVTRGESQVAEIYLPKGSDTRWVRASMQSLSHLLVSPFSSIDRAKELDLGGSTGGSEACHIDAVCNEPNDALVEAKNAVASMVFQVDGDSSVCTGSLLNDSDADTQVPYLFSAAHCFTSQAVADTLTTVFFYQSTGCNSGDFDEDAARQVAGGADILFADEPSDVLLLRLNSPAPEGATFMGWNADPITVDIPTLSIHHPAGDVKKASFGKVQALGGSELASGEFIKVRYTDAPTEGGSSGCALLTLSSEGQLQLRGGLLGGASSCDNVGDLNDPDNEDDYSRFDLVFPSLAEFLMPDTTGDEVDYSGAWFNEAQNGWGLIVVRGESGTYAMYIYHYGEDSAPTWFLTFGALDGSRFEHSALAFTGPWFGLGSFNPADVSPRPAGSVTVDFVSDSEAEISFTIDGKTVESPLQKAQF